MIFSNEDEKAVIIAKIDESLENLEFIANTVTSALESAKAQLILLGGDPRGDEVGDKVQAAVLDQIDDCLDSVKLD